MKRQAGLATEQDTMKYFDFTFEEWDGIPDSAQVKLRAYVKQARMSLASSVRTLSGARPNSV
jgi:hypothetical protein